jgi:hypothetical protein
LEQDNRPGADLLYSKLLDADIYSEWIYFTNDIHLVRCIPFIYNISEKTSPEHYT